MQFNCAVASLANRAIWHPPCVWKLQATCLFCKKTDLMKLCLPKPLHVMVLSSHTMFGIYTVHQYVPHQHVLFVRLYCICSQYLSFSLKSLWSLSTPLCWVPCYFITNPWQIGVPFRWEKFDGSFCYFCHRDVPILTRHFGVCKCQKSGCCGIYG